MLKTSRTRSMIQSARSNAWALGIASAHPDDRLNMPSTNKTGRSATFTSGPAAMLQRVAPGRGGGATYATPPRGHSTIWFGVPPTCPPARAGPNSWSITIKNSARYSSTFQVSEEYLPVFWISNAATTNQDQCRNKSIPAKRNRRIDPWRALGMWGVYFIIPTVVIRRCTHDQERTRAETETAASECTPKRPAHVLFARTARRPALPGLGS